MTPDLSVVVVSWNSARFLDGCLASVLGQTGTSVEMIVVDNGSADGSQTIVRERHPEAVLIELGENRGFCAGNNAGLARARAPYVLFANADLILERGFAQAALGAFACDERIGLVAGKILRFDRTTVDSAGQFLARSRRVVERGYGRPDGPETAREGYVFSACGAALVCRRTMIEDITVGGQFFDEDFFAFSEDIDVGWRARLAGWRAWYAPGALGYHYRGGSEESGSWARRLAPALIRRPRSLRFHILKNRWLTLIKNDAPRSVIRDLPFILPRDGALLAAAALGSPGVLLDLLRARSVFRRARSRRAQFLAATGRWGPRASGAPREWVTWRRPLDQDPVIRQGPSAR